MYRLNPATKKFRERNERFKKRAEMNRQQALDKLEGLAQTITTAIEKTGTFTCEELDTIKSTTYTTLVEEARKND